MVDLLSSVHLYTTEISYPYEILMFTLDIEFGDQEFSQADSNVVQCIINLHTLQDDTCISVKGSSCDLDDYVANGGRVQNV